MALSRGGWLNGEFKSCLEMGLGEVKKAPPRLLSGGPGGPDHRICQKWKQCVHTVGLPAPHREDAEPSRSLRQAA